MEIGILYIYCIVENNGGRKHWQIHLSELFGRENLGEWPPNKIWILKFEGKTFGDWPSIHLIFLLPSFSLYGI